VVAILGYCAKAAARCGSAHETFRQWLQIRTEPRTKRTPNETLKDNRPSVRRLARAAGRQRHIRPRQRIAKRGKRIKSPNLRVAQVRGFQISGEDRRRDEEQAVVQITAIGRWGGYLSTLRLDIERADRDLSVCGKADQCEPSPRTRSL
jgi:hypothetical protein